MSALEERPIILHADQEHSGLRLAVFVGLFVGYLIGFRLVLFLLETFAPPALLDFAIFLSCAGGLPFAFLFIWGLEKVLKRVWHSGLSIVLDGKGLYIHDRRAGQALDTPTEPAMRWSERMGQTRWYFRPHGYPRGGRERRVPAKWLCLAVELQQDENRLSVFTFMPPDEAGAWVDDPRKEFHPINPAELYDESLRSRLGPPERPMIPNRLLQSRDARYWLAERRRWEYGIELSPADFATLLRYADEAGKAETNPTIN